MQTRARHPVHRRGRRYPKGDTGHEVRGNEAGRHQTIKEGNNDMEANAITRRQMLKGVGLFAGGALLGSGLTLASTRPQVGGEILQGGFSEQPWYELGIIGEPIMDNQLLWYLSHVGQGMADVGECLDTANRIDATDENSWPKEWLETAERVQSVAENSLAKGHERGAGEAYLRA